MTAKPSKPNVPLIIESELENWVPDQSEIGMLLTQTARSLETVTKLTQYEDEKANRLLAAIAFVSAFVATLFGTIPNRFPPGSVAKLWQQGIYFRAIALGFVYSLFCLYAVMIAIGVAMIIHAVRPRFVIPKNWISGQEPTSLLFFQGIMETNPTQWAQAFCRHSPNEVALTYIKNSIVETHLISEKIAFKVKWISRGVGFFFAGALVVVALACLIVFSLVTTAAP